MAQTIELPHVGESVVEGTIGKWLKQPGDQIERFEPLVEVVTDKVTMEVPSPVDGQLVKILADEGETIPMGAPIAEVEPAEGQGSPGGSKIPGSKGRSWGIGEGIWQGTGRGPVNPLRRPHWLFEHLRRHGGAHRRRRRGSCVAGNCAGHRVGPTTRGTRGQSTPSHSGRPRGATIGPRNRGNSPTLAGGAAAGP